VTFLTTREAGGVTVLTADRPPANAMSVEFLDELVQSLKGLAADPPAALVIAGREGFFSAGVDLKEVPTYGPEQQRRAVVNINRMVLGTYGLPCPVVAAITGHAIAGGMVFALCADHRVASVEGRYGLTEIKVGVPYPQAAIGVVRAELAPHAARTLALGSRLTGAAECVALGAFDEAVAAERVVDRALEVAAELAAYPADVYARTKHDLRAPALDAMRAAAQEEPLLVWDEDRDDADPYG
jgi:enoyl-CoA hydratase